MATPAPPALPVVVTGVSSGIGLAIAEALVAAGIPVFGSVRSAADAAAFAARLGPLARPLVFDSRDAEAIAAAAASVAAATGGGIGSLVNNAGIAVPGAMELLAPADFRDQIEINLTAVLTVTQAFLPLLKRADPPGRVINISSVAAATAMPFLGAYSASKAGLEALSESLRRELAVYGIRVMVVQPGGIRTPIWKKAEAGDASAYAGTPYLHGLNTFRSLALAAGDGGLPPDHVGRVVLKLLSARRPRPHTLVTPHPVTERVMRMLPTRLLDRLIAGRLGLRPPRP